MKDIILSTLHSGWFKLILVLVVIAHVTSYFANKVEKSYKSDMQWETPPDRLPDMLDLTAANANRIAKAERILRKLENMQTKDFNIQSIESVMEFVNEIEEAAPEMKTYTKEFHTILDGLNYLSKSENPAQSALTTTSVSGYLEHAKKLASLWQAYIDLILRIMLNDTN